MKRLEKITLAVAKQAPRPGPTPVPAPSRVQMRVSCSPYIGPLLVRVVDKMGGLEPAIIRSDNGREFIAATVVTWLGDHDVTAAFIAKGRPRQNCYVERFNGAMRDELLNGALFEARVVITRWAESYNHSHRHSSLGMMTPAAFAAMCERS